MSLHRKKGVSGKLEVTAVVCRTRDVCSVSAQMGVWAFKRDEKTAQELKD